MSTTEATTRTAPDESRKRKPLASPVQSKPRRPLIAAAVAIIIIFALLFAWILNTNGQTVTVFASKNGIERGDTISTDDLSVVQIPEGEPIPHYQAAKQEAVIGKIAAVDIPAGSLITPETISTGPGIPEDKSMVGLALTNAQLPPYPLTNGNPVRVVTTPGNQADVPEELPEPVSATVVSSEVDQVSGNTLVTVMVSEDDAPRLAATAATGRAALILDGGNS